MRQLALQTLTPAKASSFAGTTFSFIENNRGANTCFSLNTHRKSHLLLRSFAPLGQPPGLPLPHRYSASLPLLCLPRCHPGSMAVRGSHVSLCRRRSTPADSVTHAWPKGPTPLKAGFGGARFQSLSPTTHARHHRLTGQPEAGHRLAATYPDATSAAAITGLSYP